MKRFVYIFLFICGVVLASSCVQERLPEFEDGDGSPIDIELKFGGNPGVSIEPTKSTLGIESESTVFNMYVFIFDSSGKKIYGKYFDHTNRGVSELSDYWEVDNYTASSPETTGTIYMHTLKKTNCRIVAICNIDAEMVNISPEQLGTVNEYSDIVGQKAKLNQLIVSRSGYFPMTGEMSNVDLTTSQISGRMDLYRLDAKIVFNVQVDPSSQIAAFSPLKWKICNVPKRAYVLERGHYEGGNFSQGSLVDATSSLADDYFDTVESNFETEVLTDDEYSGGSGNKIAIHGFSFYMMENRKAPKTSPAGRAWVYSDREKQEKLNYSGAGDYSTVKNGKFVYASDYSTYVVITARVQMDNITYGTATAGATLSGDVKYIVHLGDFSGNKFGDFNVFRNHTYTYNLTVQGVEDVRLEVENNNDADPDNNIDEPEPGATGSVSVSLEEIYTSDSHYSSHVVTFHAKHIDADKVSWVVETPFNPSGAGPIVLDDGTENTSGIDFEWVEFRLNDKDQNGQYYDAKRQIYKPMGYGDGKTMNISGLVAYLKKQKRNYDAGKDNDFDTTPASEGGPKISVTAFVNEYYYEKNPINGNYQKDLWKSFVNKPMRYMHILSETKMSADGESRIIGSSFTIQQRAIQSIYNTNNSDLNSAWGCEYVTDAFEEGKRKYNVTTNTENRGNTSLTNGRLNTVKEWGMVDANGNNKFLGNEFKDEARWEHYMNLTAENEVPIMLDAYQYLRYSCMSRNRDNNGNGIIDQDEVRWYMAASNQLIGLFLAGYGIEGGARLYQRTTQQRQSSDPEVWRQHVIASTRYPGKTNSNNNARVSWAEEGLNGSDISYTDKRFGATEYFTTRCVRNLGYDSASDGDITTAPLTSEPENYILVRRMRNEQEYPLKNPDTGADQKYDRYVYYEFDCTRINTASIRYYTDRELVAHDEHEEAASLYKKFVSASQAESETKPISKVDGYDAHYINQLNAYLDDPNHIGENPFCPSGYRLCNVREDAVIWSFVPTEDINDYLKSMFNHSRTHWSFGVAGTNDKHQSQDFWGWSIASGKMLMAVKNSSAQSTPYLRCVRDVKVE